MSRDNQEERCSYNPVNPSYTFNGNNTNYNFLLPGAYELKLNNMSGNQPGNRNRNVHFHSANETNTNVLFPNSAMFNVPASPAGVQVHGGNQPGTPGNINVPQSPMQRGFSNGATAPPGSPFANISSAATSNGIIAPPGSPFANISYAATSNGIIAPPGSPFANISSAATINRTIAPPSPFANISYAANPNDTTVPVGSSFSGISSAGTSCAPQESSFSRSNGGYGPQDSSPLSSSGGYSPQGNPFHRISSSGDEFFSSQAPRSPFGNTSEEKMYTSTPRS